MCKNIHSEKWKEEKTDIGGPANVYNLHLCIKRGFFSFLLPILRTIDNSKHMPSANHTHSNTWTWYIRYIAFVNPFFFHSSFESCKIPCISYYYFFFFCCCRSTLTWQNKMEKYLLNRCISNDRSSIYFRLKHWMIEHRALSTWFFFLWIITRKTLASTSNNNIGINSAKITSYWTRRNFWVQWEEHSLIFNAQRTARCE